MKLQYFGELDQNALDDYYSTEIELDGHQIQMDLNLEDTSIAEDRLLKVNAWKVSLK